MSKKRLEEIETKYSILTVSSEKNGTEYTEVNVEDLVFLIQNGFKQAERVQELEEEIEDWRKEVKKWQMFFREESQQNKRYREVIKRALDESVWGDEGNALHRTISILAEALEDLR